MKQTWTILGTFILIALSLGIIFFLLWFIPTYGVWKAGKYGEASLMRAEQEKRIQIEQAKAEVESAKLRAEAIEIVWEATKKFPEYRSQEFIGAFAEAMTNGAIDKVIYVPTEANIPIIEARGTTPVSQ